MAYKNKTPTIPDGLPSELQNVLLGCFVHAQEGRSSAENVIAALQPIVATETHRIADEARRAAAAATALAPPLAKPSRSGPGPGRYRGTRTPGQ